MFKIGVQTGGIEELVGIEETYRLVKEAGFDAVDVNLDHLLTVSSLRHLREYAMALPRYAVRQDEITEQMLEHIQVLDGIEFIQVHPTFLYESLWNIGVLLFLLWYLKRKKFHGEVFLLYLTGYGLGRVWIEGLRTDQLLIPGIGLPVSQVLSAVLVIGSLITIMIKRRERNARENDNRKIKNTD